MLNKNVKEPVRFRGKIVQEFLRDACVLVQELPRYSAQSSHTNDDILLISTRIFGSRNIEMRSKVSTQKGQIAVSPCVQDSSSYQRRQRQKTYCLIWTQSFRRAYFQRLLQSSQHKTDCSKSMSSRQYISSHPGRKRSLTSDTY